MITELDPDAVLTRFWAEIQKTPEAAGLVALVPSDRRLGLVDAMWLLPAVLRALGQPSDQIQLLDALAHAYARARGLHFMEE